MEENKNFILEDEEEFSGLEEDEIDIDDENEEEAGEEGGWEEETE